MSDFTPIASTVGGLLIGAAAALLLWSHGKIAGISGIVGGLLEPPPRGDAGWRWFFLVGLIGAGAIGMAGVPSAFSVDLVRSPIALATAGLLVGLGTRMGGGCTSGHGVCGIGRLSIRSLVATLAFMASGAITVFVVRTWFGGEL